MKIKSYIILLLLAGFFSCDQTDRLEQVKFLGSAQGTYYALTYYDEQGRNFQHSIDSLLRAFDLSVSTYIDESIITHINKNDPDVVADEVFIDIFNKSIETSEKTNGAFDVTIAPLVNAWGFGFTDRMKVDSTIVDSLLQYVGYEKIKLLDGTIMKEMPESQLDFNAIAQGYSVDLVGQFLESKDIKRYLVDIGGEVLAKGLKPEGKKWTVGIEKPTENIDDERRLDAIVELEDGALATSGSYRKFYEENGVRYSHTINPKSGYPVNHSVLSVSVKAADCCTADAFATAFMIMGLDETKEYLLSNPGLDVYVIFSNEEAVLETYISKGMEKLLVSKN